MNNEQNHADSDFCIMGYQNIDNGIVEFSFACLLTGSSDNREDGLRKSEDK